MKKLMLVFLFINSCVFLTAQPIDIIDCKQKYKRSIDSNMQKKMLNVQKLIPSIILDLRYKTKNNFT